MNCQEAQKLIHPYMDGELDLMNSLEVEQHLQDCAVCSQVYKNQQALRAAIGSGALYFQAPASLRKRIQSSVRQADPAVPARRATPWRWLAAAAGLAIVLLLAWGLARALSAPSTNDVLTQEIIASHIRSLMPGHLADVASTDQHTVKPWFNGKLDFSPPVVNLADQGFPLVGGRLDYVDNRPVAALVYHRQQHIINLYVWPAQGAQDTNPKTETRQGYHLVEWTKSGMTFWAISDVSESDLQEFVGLVRSQATP